MHTLIVRKILLLVFLHIYSVYGIGVSSKLDFDDTPNSSTTSPSAEMKSGKLESFIVLGQPLPKNPKGEFESVGAINVDHSTQILTPNKPATCIAGNCNAKFKPNSNDDFLLTNVQVQVVTALNKDKNATKKPDLHEVPVYRGGNPDVNTFNGGPNFQYGIQEVPVYQNLPGSYETLYSTTRRPIYITPKPSKMMLVSEVEVFPSKSVVTSSTAEPLNKLTITNLDPNYNDRNFGENAPPTSVWITNEQNLNSYNPKGFYPITNRRRYDYNPQFNYQGREKIYQPSQDFAPIRYNPDSRTGSSYDLVAPNLGNFLPPNTNYNSNTASDRRSYGDVSTLISNPHGVRNYPGNSFTRVSYPEHFITPGTKCTCGAVHQPENHWSPFANIIAKPAVVKVDDKVEKLNSEEQ